MKNKHTLKITNFMIDKIKQNNFKHTFTDDTCIYFEYVDNAINEEVKSFKEYPNSKSDCSIDLFQRYNRDLIIEMKMSNKSNNEINKIINTCNSITDTIYRLELSYDDELQIIKKDIQNKPTLIVQNEVVKPKKWWQLW